MRRVPFAAPAMMLAGLMLYGCHMSQARKAADEPKQLAAADVGQKAPDLEGEDMNGQPLRLAEYKGQVVVLHFWANW